MAPEKTTGERTPPKDREELRKRQEEYNARERARDLAKGSGKDGPPEFSEECSFDPADFNGEVLGEDSGKLEEVRRENRQITREVEEVLKASEPEPPDPVPVGAVDLALKSIPLDKFLATEYPPLERLLPFMAPGQLGMVYGPPGAGKTWNCLYMALALASGQPFYHWLPLRPLRVALADGESQKAELQERLRLLTEANPLLAGAGKNLSILPVLGDTCKTDGKPWNFKNPEHQSALLRFVNRYNPEVLILDNLSALIPGAEMDGVSWGEETFPWLRQIKATGTSVVLIHHTGKDKSRGPRGFSGMTGGEDWEVLVDGKTDTGGTLSGSWKLTKHNRGIGPCMPMETAWTLLPGADGGLELASEKLTPETEIVHLLKQIHKAGGEVVGLSAIKEMKSSSGKKYPRSTAQKLVEEARSLQLLSVEQTEPKNRGNIYRVTAHGESYIEPASNSAKKGEAR